MANWNGVSSKVSLSKTSSSSTANAKVYVGSNNLPQGWYGRIDMYSYNWLGQIVEHKPSDVKNGTNFEKVTIHIDKTQATGKGFSSWNQLVKLVVMKWATV
ncbi:hypothetical protein [Lysinibacillus sp. 54212]|uniref:hypothetical protein n=1 Tax=Lysinibacillus sp. 54212 TaxID=3119829 RepID=UPI002FC6A5BA